ncbi:hypothetical protein K2173_021972 [Erythroxylum novogranatense]|uniref:5-formyltetrahydrofolate cyclo-ligase n=1 Tax=Erythroxylum novogranatense TaxID=1862640 RepID=A0AAV8T468_9ROSI|nr:hypothetical protein K2173_021972 [Erythroxylum novogranatense]
MNAPSIQTSNRTPTMFHRFALISGRILNNPNLRRTSPSPPFSFAVRSAVTMNRDSVKSGYLDAIFEQKRALRSKIRKELKNMDPMQRSLEDDAIQRIVLEAPWFKASKSLCAYISCASLREVDTSRIVSEVLSNVVKCLVWQKHMKKVYYQLTGWRFLHFTFNSRG